MVSPSLCGGFLSDKRSMVAFTWTITTLLTLFAFLTAVILVIQIHTHYHRMERYYESDDWYQSQYSKYSNGDDDQNNNNNNNGGGGSQEENEAQENIEKTAEAYMLLASLSARSITFVPVYTMILAVGLSWYGSTAIVGFTSLRGVYIAPCFSSGPNTMAVGIFGGAIVIFANLLLVCAVILGEVRVEDYSQNRDGEETEPYRVERISTVLALTCMFLSALYTIFAVLLFLCYASENILSEGGHRDEHHDQHQHQHHHRDINNINTHGGVVGNHNINKQPGVTVNTNGGGGDQHQHQRSHMDSPGFITMEGSS